MRHLTFAVLAAAAAAAACAPTPAGGGMTGPDRAPRACFVTGQVQNFRSGEEQQTLYLRAGRAGVFQLETVGWCRDLDWANQLAIVSESSGGSRLCADDRALIVYRGGGSMPNGPCRARVVRRLTDAEVAALPGRSRP